MRRRLDAWWRWDFAVLREHIGQYAAGTALFREPQDLMGAHHASQTLAVTRAINPGHQANSEGWPWITDKQLFQKVL
jgi:hypothetical protein